MSSGAVVVSSKEQFTSVIQRTRIVAAYFYEDDSEPCQQITPYFERLTLDLARSEFVTFAQINHAQHSDISREYEVTRVPTFLVFRNAEVIQRSTGFNPREIQSVLGKVIAELEVMETGLRAEAAGAGPSGDSGRWKGADIPRGYSDITDQVEIRNCELLNADEEAGPVKVLFDETKPSALNNGKASSKDWVQSGSDDQLLLFIPFQSSIKVHTLQLTSLPPKDEDDAPSRPEVIHLFINRPQNIDFDEADDTEPTQAITLTEKDWNAGGTATINLRFVKFQKTTTLILYVQKGVDGAETVRLDRLRIIGEAGAKREMGKLQKVGDEEGE